MLLNFKEWTQSGQIWYITSPDGQQIPFARKHNNPDRTVVVVDPQKLDKGFAQSPSHYVGPGGEGEVKGRVANFNTWFHGTERWHRGQTPVEMPIVSFSVNRNIRQQHVDDPKVWQVWFEDGRHRFSWLRDNGYREIPVEVPKDDADDMKARFG